jgi:hypothetical protein
MAAQKRTDTMKTRAFKQVLEWYCFDEVFGRWAWSDEEKTTDDIRKTSVRNYGISTTAK